VSGKRDNFERRGREIPRPQVDPVANERPATPKRHITEKGRSPAIQVHGSQLCELGTPKLSVHDRHEINVAAARTKASHARRPNYVEALNALRNSTIQPSEQILYGAAS
jgi:hypothetical protein